jgi:CMP-N-acetylneuraminic acid synthetase
MSDESVLAIIPARGGSKGIPRKNIADLAGKPLIAYSIQAALRARRVTRVVVSTDDEEIAAVARQWGAEVPFLRSPEIGGDRAVVGDAVVELLRRLAPECRPEAYALLFPTHPFRTPELIDFLLEKLFLGYRRVVTVRPIPAAQARFHALAPDGGLIPVCRPPKALAGPEGLLFRSYGLFSAHRLRGPVCRGCYVHHIREPWGLVDIDEPEDLRLAATILSHGLFPGGAA